MFLLAALLVLLITVAFYLLEKGLMSFLFRDHMLTEQMKFTALNELKVINLNRELAIKYQLVDTNARLEERENISRNIHNVVGHTITSAIVSLQAYRVLQDTEPQRAEDKLAAASERMRLALEEIRRAVRVLDLETKEISLKDFQQLMIAELERFSIDTDLEVFHNLEYLEAEQFMDKRCCEFLHSALTECLNNGIRHGNATSFMVFMQWDANHIGLSVTDNGTGFQQLSKAEQESRLSQGYGIRKMKQFVFEHGGKMKIISESGFSISLELPMTKSLS
jgi:signal transduction histidine kinase